MTRANMIALAEAVERGDAFGWYDWLAHERALPEGVLLTAREAHHGDLNASVRLVETLLPGWTWSVGGNNWGAVIDHDGSDDLRDLKHFAVKAANPARSLLLAVLRAKIEAE